MASGFFLGGAAEGIAGAQKQALAERAQTEQTGLQTRGLELQERQFANTVSQQTQKEADTRIAETMQIASETIKAGLEGGADPAKLRATVAPLVQSAQAIAARIGRNPAALSAQIDAQLTAPGPVAAAGVKGRAAGVQQIEQERAIQQQPPETRVEISPWKTPKERIENEDKLRDDFEKNSKEFKTVRDFYDRMKTAPTTGAGDLALIFSYMKMLDPASTVREGEQASASNAAGVPAAITGMYNQLRGGGRLADDARTQLKEAAGKVWGGALDRHSQMVTQYTNIAKRNKLDPRNVVVDLTAGSDGPIGGTTPNGINWNLGSSPVR